MDLILLTMKIENKKGACYELLQIIIKICYEILQNGREIFEKSCYYYKAQNKQPPVLNTVNSDHKELIVKVSCCWWVVVVVGPPSSSSSTQTHLKFSTVAAPKLGMPLPYLFTLQG